MVLIEKGKEPFMRRFFHSGSRVRTFQRQAMLGAAALAFAGLVNAQPPMDLTLQADKATGATNEVILKLNYAATTALARISPGLGKPRAETEVEAEVVRALNEGKSADLTAISPRASARFLLTQNRMTDEERAEHEVARSTGRIPANAYDPRLSLNQYIVVRTVSMDAAKALVDYAQRSGVANYAQINLSMGVSATPSDSFFSPPYYPVANHYQWDMHTMNFPAAWDVTKGHAYVGASNQYDQAYGNVTSGPQLPPSAYFVLGPAPEMSKAEVWVITTSQNPANPAAPLTPLVRMTWRCGDSTPAPSVCSSKPSHVDTVLVEESEISSFYALGYRVDGVEGYSYPRSATKPAGTVALLRRYNAARDDHAVFPETALSTMTALGYTVISGLSWLGYAYANPTSGAMPTY